MEGFFIFDILSHKKGMKNVFQVVLLTLYFFVFLISESTLNLYLSWDRIMPQFLFLSILNTLTFANLLRNNLLLTSINSALGNNKSAKKYLSPQQLIWLKELNHSSTKKKILYYKDFATAWEIKLNE